MLQGIKRSIGQHECFVLRNAAGIPFNYVNSSAATNIPHGTTVFADYASESDLWAGVLALGKVGGVCMCLCARRAFKQLLVQEITS